jgi:hypothetical protein
MSEYSDTTAVSKMIGTTAGYVGYDDNSNTFSISSNRMTEYGLRRTFSVNVFELSS